MSDAPAARVAVGLAVRFAGAAPVAGIPADVEQLDFQGQLIFLQFAEHSYFFGLSEDIILGIHPPHRLINKATLGNCLKEGLTYNRSEFYRYITFGQVFFHLPYGESAEVCN